MEAGDSRYEAEIRWTTHGVPHIRATDWGSLGFGQGYAIAGDHLATIADQIVKVRSERAAFFGPGEGDRHLHSDFGYLALGVRERARDQADRRPDDLVATVEGYAAGINAWLAEHGTGALPEWCRGAEWFRPVSALDLFTLYADLAIIASGRNLADYIGSATPPGGDASPPPPSTPPSMGSNGWALGRDATTTGRGMVMANPHFPWDGEARFWECHLTIPGELDVYGASLLGTPGVQIGFNEHVAWTHTFSRGHRFTVYKLDLEGPTTYRYGDEVREMESTLHTVEVATPGGPEPVSRELWSSHYGPMVNLPFLGWSDTLAFTYRDANLDNDRFLPLVADLDRAASVEDVRDTMARHEGLPWVNTVAADDRGRCWYIDSSPTPSLSREAQVAFAADLDANPITQLLFANRVALLDGSDPRYEWVEHDDAAAPGLVPFDELPQLGRDDHVFNANDPYWLPHAEAQLPEHQVLHGLYQQPVSPRTRMNALLLAGRGPVRPADGDRFGPDDLEAAVLGNHSLLADLLCDGVVARARAAGEVEVDGRTVDVADAADLLDRWDGRFDLDSVGAVVWREFLGSFTDEQLRDAGPLFAEGFDAADPVHTPRGLAPAPADGVDPVVAALGRAVSALSSAGIPLDVPLGDVQFVERGGRRIALHGANEIEGIANVVAPFGTLARSDLEPGGRELDPVPGRTERTGLRVGGYPAVYGASFLMVAWFDDDGPHGRGLLTYGQSGDPASPHHVDQMEAFSRKELRPLRFRDAEIAADPELRTETVRG